MANGDRNTSENTGADVLVQTLLRGGVDTCFANPGTSEMHLVAAIDRAPGMRAVLGLFEGVVTGAADGYARIAGKPAATLLHLGPGLANGLANLHNARKAGTPVINVVGDHAAHHLKYDAPLTSDIDALAGAMSHWVGRAETADRIGARTAEALAATRGFPGRIATLILPADSAWNRTRAQPEELPTAPGPSGDGGHLDAMAEALRRHGPRAMLLVGGSAVRAPSLRQAEAVSRATGCRIAAPGSNAVMDCGGGLPRLPRIPYVVDMALDFLADVDCLVTVGAPVPVAFFAYPDKPSLLIREGCEVVKGCGAGFDPAATLALLAERLPAGEPPRSLPRELPASPEGALTPETVAAALTVTLPDHAIVVDESITSGRLVYAAMANAGPFTLLNNMGGSIGYGLPVALGAAVASPGRRVLALIGDGSAFYTEQALWSLAREAAHVTVVIFANRSYAILRGEWTKTGAGEPGTTARDMLTLDRPDPDWVSIARGHGVDAERVDDAAAFVRALRTAHATPGPRLIEVRL